MPSYNKLSLIEKDIAIACIQPKIKDLRKDELLTLMLGLIGKTYLNLGQEMDSNQVNMTIDELCEDLQKYNGTLSFAEIQIAFKNGWKKQYGDFFGLNNATYFGWVNGYTWSESRLRAKRMIEDAKRTGNEPKPEVSEEQREEIMRNGALKMFEDHKAGGSILDPGNVVYEYLLKKGLINFPRERKEEIRKKTEDEMKAAAISNKDRAETIESVLKKVMVPDIIKANSKRTALKEFFNQLIEMGEALEV
jgi:hypothetical protein